MPRASKRLLPLLLRAFVIASIFACIGIVAHKHQARSENTLNISPAKITQWFPNAKTIDPPTGDLNASPVLDAEDTILGYILQTHPSSQEIIGYTGPTNTLVALSPQQKILGFRILTTADTSTHIAKIDNQFWNQYTNRTPATLPPNPTTTSGATLTTEAITKAIQARLTNTTAKPWFQQKINLTQAKTHFPTATQITPSGKTHQVLNASNNLLGHLILSTDCPDQARGFQGPSALLIALSPDQKILLNITLLASRDNQPYTTDVQQELTYTDQFTNIPVTEILTTPDDTFFLSGASYTTTAVVAQLRSTLQWLQAPTPEPPPLIHWKLRDTLLTIWLIIAVAIGITHLRGSKKIRLTLQITCILLGGIYLGTLITQGLLIGWARNGIPWQTYPALTLLAAASIILPLTTGKNIYCQHICPHGALQNTLFDLTKKKIHIHPTLHKTLSTIPWLLLAAILVLAIIHWTGDFTIFETFDAWSTGLILSIPVILFFASFLTAPFIRTPYCHYACPTGALLRFVSGPKHRILKRDIIVLILAASAWFFTLI